MHIDLILKAKHKKAYLLFQNENNSKNQISINKSTNKQEFNFEGLISLFKTVSFIIMFQRAISDHVEQELARLVQR